MIKNEISSLQRYLWLDQKLTPESPKYNIGGFAIINGYIDFQLFKKSIAIFSNKHHLLKSFFREEVGNPFSFINEKALNTGINYFEKNSKQEAIDLIQKDFKEPFVIEMDERLFNIWLIRTSPNTFIWYTKLHHLIADGYSFQLLFNEISAIYKSLTGDAILNEDDTIKGFEQHVEEETAYYNSDTFSNDKDYWKRKYNVFPELIYNKQFQESYFYDKELNLSDASLQKLQLIGKQHGVSIFHILLASFSVTLAKFYFKDEIHIGTPILNRLSRADRKIFGPFINLLPLQIKLDDEFSFLALIKQIKKDVFSMFRHQRFQQAEIIKALSYKGNRLYDVRISYESFDYKNTFSTHDTDIVALSNYSEEDPISVHIMDYSNEGLKFRFDINGNYVPEYITDEFIKSLQYILENTTDLLNENIKTLSIATKEQEKEIKNISIGEIRERKARSFPELWKENIGQFSSNNALIFKDEKLSYKEVDEKISSVVSYLHKEGIRKGDRVGILLDRSINIVPVILGVLQSGATYVPIDKTFPRDRIAYVIQDSNIKLLLIDDDILDFNCTSSLIQEIFDVKSQQITTDISIFTEDEAYIIYTSGSSGKPKGVSIKHESLVDYSTTFSEYFRLDESDCVIQQSSFVFDTSIEEIFPVLSVGGTLVISENPKDFHRLLQECSTHNVSLLSTNPFVVQYLNDNQENYAHSFKTLISGGDVLKKEQVNKLLGKVDVYNTYGPTESTVCATYHKVTPSDTTLPIGKPIANRNVFIVNNDKLLPKGSLGEIVLAGKGLAKGYINNELLTKSLFVEIEGERVYKTGDLGQWDSQGDLLFYGRKDNQLSFRGYRIEAAEIEQTIKLVDSSIKNCHVTIKELQGSPNLVAYLSSDTDVSYTSLTKELNKKLPAYMIPNRIVVLDKFPLNTSGKVDEKNLPLPKIQSIKKGVTLPSTKEEEEIAVIWKKLLNLKEVDIHTNFFELGGHSLLANQFIGIIREKRKQDISLKEFYEAPTIHEIVKVIETKEVSNLYQLEKAPEQELYPLSYPQERLWFLDQLNQDNKSYYVPRAIKMTGELNLERIEKAFTLLTEKHEVLRTVFPVIEGIPYQRILEPFYFHIPLISFEEFSKEEQDKKIEDFISKEGKLNFDLENGPLLRVYILQRSKNDNILIFCEHHLIHDGWTQGILLREFVDIYSKLIEDKDYQVVIPKLQFKDFSYWQKSFFDDERLSNHMSFWRQKLDGHVSVLSLPQNDKRPKQITGNGQLLHKTIEAELSDKIRRFSTENGSTLFITMLAAFKVTLSRFSNEPDICIGTAVANRRLASIENILGMVINTIALRTQFDEADSLGEALDKVKDTCFEAYTHEDTPFGKVVEHIAPKRSLGLMPLFQYMFSFMNTPSRNLFLPDLELEIVESHNLSAKFDINVVVVPPFEQAMLEGTEERNRTIIVEWEYNSDIYSEEVMTLMLDSYFNILEVMVSSPTVPYKDVSCIEPKHENELLEVFNDTYVDYPRDKTIVDLFREQVLKNPKSVAIVYQNKQLTYQELEDLSNGLANYMLTQNKIEKDAIIGIKLQRDEWIVISMLAVLKTGAAYVSIDPDFPRKRIEFITEDSKCDIIIDSDFLKKFKSSTKNINIPTVTISSNHLAYIIYTSGSTGLPKGVMVEHRNLVNFLFDYQLSIHNTSLTCKTIFDVSVFEIMGSITSGSTLFIPEEDIIYSPTAYAVFLYENKISHCYIHPMHLEEVAKKLATYNEIYLSKILIGVEGIKPNSVTWYFDNNIEIINAYGPSECTICTTKYKVESLEEIKTSNIPIGTPLQNYQTYILDELTNQLQPKGVIGELCISGAGLSRGYLNDPELTSEKFISHPFKDGDRLYKTGDLARWLPDGTIEFIGRKDSQVKLRGYRIELGEIEYALTSQEDISQAVVTIAEYHEGKYLVAHVVHQGDFDVENIKQKLREYLPDYMIPNHIIQINTIPLTPNGKIDRKSLPKIKIDEISVNKYVAPRNEVEKKLAEIWQDILGVEQVGITDNFFELGGHSLKVTQLINKMNKVLSSTVKVKEVFTYPTIASLSDKIKDKETTTIPLSPPQEYYPLSSSQRRLWILSQFEGGNMAYNIPGVFQMKGTLDIDVLTASFRHLIARHESLRTRFVTKEEEVYQQIVNEQDIAFTIDKQEFLEGDVEDLITSFYKETFDLGQAPLLKARVLQTSATDYYLLFAIHHIIGDGWSMEVLSKELMYVYNHLLSNTSFELPELRIQYKEYVLWQESEDIQHRLLVQESYWKEKLSGELPVLELPSYHKRPLIKTYNGATKLYDFSQELSAKLNSFCKAQGVTLYMSLLSGVNGLFYRYTNATDIILGTPIAGRSHPELEHQVGLYLNTLAIRTIFDTDDSFASLLEKQKQTLLEAYEHQDYPLDRLVEDLALKRDTSRSALFDVMVVLQNQQETFIELDNLAISGYQGVSRKVSQFDMTFSFSEDSTGIHLRVEYNSDIYDIEQVDQMCIHLERFIDSALHFPEQSIDTLSYLTDTEETELLHTFNTTEVAYPKDKTVLDLFRDQVTKNPESIAIIHQDKELTYQELEVLSNAMANDLLATGLIAKETLIGVALERSEWLIISLLAVLKTGGAYVPIDPLYPKHRIDYIKENSQCAFVITEDYIEEFKQKEKDRSAPEIALDTDQLAYIIYTSGSTGKPKGVMIEHKNTLSLIQWATTEFNSSKFDILYFSTSHCFDLSVYEIFYPLSIGKKIRIIANGLSIPRYLEKDKNVLINTVPSVVQSLIDGDVGLSNVSILNMAGEVIPTSFTKSLSLTNMDVYNLYGPSEDTTYSTCHKIEKVTEESISIGKPIANTQVFILDELTNQLQPKGVMGELCISGAGLSRGYLNDPELTSEKFIPHPFKDGDRLYKTGDLARWLPDGTIEFIGRKDSQVKIRGYRIELGEIEYALTSQEDISQAVVTITGHHEEKYIVAHVVGQGDFDAEVIKSSLREYLPGYMIPNHIIQIDAIPLTPNGKIDRESLPKIKIDEISVNKYVAPRNEVEKKLAEIWQDVLGVEKVGITDNFFELGGNSIKVVTIRNRINNTFEIAIQIESFFKEPTLQNISEVISILSPKNSEESNSQEDFEEVII